MNNGRYFDFGSFGALPNTEKLKALVLSGSWAPSSHNVQPWHFRIEDSQIILKPNFERRLPLSDKLDRQLFISLGAALGNIILASQSYGLLFKFEIFAKGSATVTYDDLEVHDLDLETLNALAQRHNNRFPFEDKVLPQDFIEKIQRIAGNEVTLSLITDQEIKAQLAKIAKEAIGAAFLDKGFTEELSKWVRPSVGRHEDGMVGGNMGVPFVISFFLSWMIKHLNLSKQQMSLLEPQFLHPSAMAVLSAQGDDIVSWMNVGKVFEAIAVEAQKRGIKVGVQAAPIEIGNFYQELQRALNLKNRPQMFFRLGYADKVPPLSPRLLPEKILISQ